MANDFIYHVCIIEPPQKPLSSGVQRAPRLVSTQVLEGWPSQRGHARLQAPLTPHLILLGSSSCPGKLPNPSRQSLGTPLHSQSARSTRGPRTWDWCLKWGQSWETAPTTWGLCSLQAVSGLKCRTSKWGWEKLVWRRKRHTLGDGSVVSRNHTYSPRQGLKPSTGSNQYCPVLKTLVFYT